MFRRGETSLDGRTCLLTGASSGIGRSLAVELARAGADLAITARRDGLLDALADRIEHETGKRPVTLAADLSRRDEAAGLAALAEARLGPIDILVCNAGAGHAAWQWAGGDDDACRTIFETNLWSPLALLAALVPGMRARGTGAVVTVTSMGKVVPVPLVGHYNATKAALSAATETLRLELRGSGVTVLEVVPGLIETPMLDDFRTVPGVERAVRRAPHGTPDRLARLVVGALRSGRPRLVYPRACIPGHVLPALGRLAAGMSRPDPDEPPAPPRQEPPAESAKIRGEFA